jgi:hypothetical protein
MIMVMNLQGEVRMVVHTGKQFVCTRRIYLVCDTIMVVHIDVLCIQYAYAQLFFITSIVISCVAQLNLELSALLQVILHRLMFRLESAQCILD